MGLPGTSVTMRQLLVIGLLVGFGMSACAKEVPPPPVQGPAVLSDGIEIEDWEYLGPNAVESFPQLSATVREVGNDIYQARLIQRDDGFELVWSQLPCATQPVVVIHADMSIEFWPGESVDPHCVAMGVLHMLTVRLHTDIPTEQWEFTIHTPPEPDA